MGKVLIVVHVEPFFENDKNAEYMHDLVKRIRTHYNRSKYRSLINVECGSEFGESCAYAELDEFNTETWMWGCDVPSISDNSDEEWLQNHFVEGVNWCRTTSPHEYAEIPEWVRELSKHDEYVLCGGARGECLQDFIDIFECLGFKYSVNENLTY